VKLLFVFDADNTLWDTNAVFSNAQLSLLRVLESFDLIANPELQLPVLRHIDRLLFKRLNRFEYDFKTLSVAVSYFFVHGNLTPEELVEKVLHPSFVSSGTLGDIAKQAFLAYGQSLEDIPEIFPDAKTTLKALRSLNSTKCSVVILLLSEGNFQRLQRILQSHKMFGNQYFDEIMVESSKTRDVFARARARGLERLACNNDSECSSFVVGDSLKRDIKYGNQCGFTTVYKPAGFMGIEIPRDIDEEPTLEISNLEHLIPSLINYQLIPSSCEYTSRLDTVPLYKKAQRKGRSKK
jgi:putative hydrolase of the HAD superfamily